MNQLKTAEDFLLERMEIPYGQKVRYCNEPLEGAIVGFIPVLLDEFIDIEKIQVNALIDIVRFPKQDKTGNLRWEAQTISKELKAAVEKIPITKDKIFIENLASKNTSRYADLFNRWEKYEFTQICVSLQRLFPERIVVENETYFYVPDENEYVLKSGGRIRSVSKRFLCVCSHINPVTGKINYALKPLNELVPVLEK